MKKTSVNFVVSLFGAVIVSLISIPITVLYLIQINRAADLRPSSTDNYFTSYTNYEQALRYGANVYGI